MKNKYGCKYFKLDANNWGALPFGKRYLKNATCIEGYRMGMQRILDAVGDDGIILGCNAPMWPSLGLVHCMRVSTDVSRSWGNYKQVAYECFHRGYQNDMFWRNDPDCFVFKDLQLKLFDPAANKNEMEKCLTANEKYFHLTSLLAVGGLKFLSDRMNELTKDEFRVLQKVVETDFGKIKFVNDDYSIAQSQTESEKYALFFNNTDNNLTRKIEFEGKRKFKDYWTDEIILAENNFNTFLEPHSAKAYLINEMN
jgi:alpha-galactosidase